ncbi:MAG: phosphate ABC transporter permease subunit PstC [Gammaproteobacteria bacterium]
MRRSNVLFRWSLSLTALTLPATLAALVAFLCIHAWPAFHYNGLHFLTHNDWNLGSQYGNPITVNGTQILPGASYGILFLIAGTGLSSLIALVLAVPIGLGAALFLSEAVPGKMRDSIALFVELLASVPSVVFGLWGYVVLIPLMAHHVYPHMASLLSHVPFFGPPTYSGYGLLTAGLVLALMIVPLITANLREAATATPPQMREAARAMGATGFEVVIKVLIPRLRRPLIGVSTLALGRALGETMAVLMVSGNALGYLPNNIYSPISTMAAFIVSQLDSALQDPTGMAVYSLTEIGLVLLVLSLLVNGAARLLLRREA